MYVRLERLTADEVEMATAKKQLKDDRLYLRVSSKEREVISEAAEAAHKDLSAFVLDAALVSAESVLANRRLFALDKASWQEFNAILDRPVVPLSSKPRLEKLLYEPSVLEL
jgi:uncharacterized protein (DUF1778 family)